MTETSGKLMNRPGPDAGCHATEKELEVDDCSDSPSNTLYYSYIKIQNTQRVLTGQTNMTCH
jgi:hypothetical protein